MGLHADVQRVIDAYLRLVDEEAPGVVEGLYLVGSAALADFRPRTSDIDFLAVSSKSYDAAAVSALSRAHTRLRSRYRRPFFDGRYVTWDALARDPRHAAPGPYALGGRFHASGRSGCDPVTWHTLASHGVRCRGPERAALPIWTDPAALRSWTLDNFESYWRALVRRACRFGDPWSLIALTSYGTVWIALGVCRLHYTLATDRIGSKEEAGQYGIRTFPERWHRVLHEALRIRRADRVRADAPSAFAEILSDFRIRKSTDGGSLYTTPVGRRRDVIAFAGMVIRDAKSRFGSPS